MSLIIVDEENGSDNIDLSQMAVSVWAKSP